MSTADKIVKGALYMIGAHSEIKEASPAILEEGLAKLVSMLREHARGRLYYGAKLESLTSAALVATGTLTTHDLEADDAIFISGAAEDEYNGEQTVVAAPTADTFTYALDEADDTPATDADSNFGIRVLNFPEELADQVHEDPAATESLKSLLAVRMAPTCRKPITEDVRTAAAQGIATLQTLFEQPDVPSIVPSRLMPRGQGASRGPLSDTFFRGQDIDADSSS